MSELAILVPVLNRPHRVRPLLASIRRTTPEARVLLLCDPGDDEELAEVERSAADFIAPGGNYAEKINLGIELTQAPLIFLGADDLEFHPGWFEAAKAKLNGAIGVVGTNDLIPRSRQHSTHFLVTREYAERPTVDGEAGPLHEGYHHWCCDDELIATAKLRDAYAYAEDAIVEHLHPYNDKAEWDDTYRLGHARRRDDKRRFRERSRLWAST